jgi:uncharacterized protein involved in exopolysaccharide biosynthesis
MVAPQQSNEPTQGVQQPLAAPDEDEFSLLDLMIALGEGKWWLLVCTLLGAAVGLVLVWDAPKASYTAKAAIVLPGATAAAATGGASAQLQTLAALGGINLGALSSPSGGAMTALFYSDRLADTIAESLQLKERWKPSADTQLRTRLRTAIELAPDKKTGLTVITASDQDPVFAAALANEVVVALRKLSGDLALSDAQQRRMTLEIQIEKARDAMVRSEFALRELDKKLGVKTHDARGDLALSAAAGMRSQIIALEVQQQTMRTYANDKHPDMQALNAQIHALRAQLTKLEDASGVRNNKIFDGTAVPNAQQVEHAKAVSEARHRANTYEALVRQLELARADEARQGAGVIQQIDKASVPDIPDERKPRRAKVLTATGIGFGLGLMLALLSYFYRKAEADPESREKLRLLARAWSPLPRK